LGVGLTTPHHKKQAFYERSQDASDLGGFFDKRPKRKKMDMKFGKYKNTA
jgi:hypothetical protein